MNANENYAWFQRGVALDMVVSMWRSFLERGMDMYGRGMKEVRGRKQE